MREFRSVLGLSGTVWMILSWPGSCGLGMSVHFWESWCRLSGGVEDANVAAVGGAVGLSQCDGLR